MTKRGRPPTAKTLIARAALAAYTGAVAPVKPMPKARYDAAGAGRRMVGWNPPAQGPNRALEGLQKIRNRARDASSNDWSGESGIQKWTTSLVGIGITPRFKRIQSRARKLQIIDLWNDFVAKSDADCVLNLYGQQTLVVRSWLDAGEVFVRRRQRFLDEGLPVPMQIQIIEAEFVPLLDADTYQGLPAGNKIRSGIELDKRGRRVAYWIFKEHPGDGANLGYQPDELVRVLASDICHVYEPKRPGQLRGVSMLVPVLNRLKNIENYDDATLTRQQLANLVVGFISRGEPEAGADDDTDPLTGLPLIEGPSGPLAGMQPGTLQELDDGQKVEWSNPPEAGTMYSEYMRTQHMGTAAAAGIPYEIFSGDIANVSDRTLRVLINEFRRFNEQRQWQIIIPMFCQRAVDWFAEAALAAGLIEPEEFDDVRRVEHAPHGWASARDAATALLAPHERPSAIFASSDTQALGVLEAAATLGLDVPGDVALIGFDDLEVAAHVGLSTVRQPLRESGAVGAQLLLDVLDAPAKLDDVPEIRLELELVARRTTIDDRSTT